MLHYHGTPLTPRDEALMKMGGRSFCVSFAAPRDVEIAHEIGQSVMLDNGAFTHWRQGKGQIDLAAYAEWVRPWLDHKTTWCIIPDVIGGTEAENDELLFQWMDYDLPYEQCAPVWHMHESLERLRDLCELYPMVCIGSSGEYSSVYTKAWHARMTEVMDFICDETGVPPCKLHMLRGLGVGGGPYPFYSADSTNIARNWNLGKRGGKQDIVAMANRIDSKNTPPRWTFSQPQLKALADTDQLHRP